MALYLEVQVHTSHPFIAILSHLGCCPQVQVIHFREKRELVVPPSLILSVYRIFVYKPIRRFPEIGVPLNHPFMDGYSLK
jgi:hypothetical protein